MLPRRGEVMGEDDLIRRGDALRAIDPGHGDFHAGNYNAIAALPVVDKAATIARLQRELAEARDDAGALLAQLAAAEKYMAKTEAELEALKITVQGLRAATTRMMSDAASAPLITYVARPFGNRMNQAAIATG